MNRLSPALALAALAAFSASPVTAQTTFTACRVPNVGAIYMIGVSGAPSACLDASHVEFSWTEGGAPADGSITTAKLADGAVTQAKLDPGITIGVGPGGIGTTELADGAVTSSKIADGTIASGDIQAGAVGSAQVADNSLTFQDLAPGSVTNSELVDNAVGSSKIADGAITAADFATNLFQWAQVASNGNVLGSSGGVTATKVSTGTYDVVFPVSLGGQSNCAHVASSIQGARFVEIVHGDRFTGGNQFTLRVNLYDSSVVFADGAFNLVAICT